MPWLTPDEDGGRRKVCRRLTFYAEYASVVAGAISELLAGANWEESGDITPDQAIQEAHDMWLDYREIPCMIGSIVPFATEELPDGILPCDGSVHDRADFPALYAALAATFIIDSDSFYTPDLSGRVVVGVGSGSGLTSRAMNGSGGEETHTLSTGEMPSHFHSQNNTPGVIVMPIGPPSAFVADAPPGLPAWTGYAGGDGAHENMPPFRALTYGIVAR